MARKRQSIGHVPPQENSDMFSLLPESLLLIIVSFLPFKEAARTCILSKRWLELWKSTKNVEFNELFFVNLDESDSVKESQRRVFLNFVTRWIQDYKDHVVDKFSLKVSLPENCRGTIERCVAFATQRGVKELGLDFSDPKWEENNFDDRDALFQLPKHVYRHGSLESLKLYSCSFVMPDLLNFRTLKDVSLGWIEVNISTLKTLLSTCKMIENLSLKKCWNLANFDLGEEKLGLRRLVIDKCHFENDYFIFKAPNLKFLKYSGVVGIFDIDLCPHVMEEADIDFALESDLDESGNDLGNDLCKVLVDLYPVRVLTVCSFVLQAVHSGDEPLRVQCDLNVRHLIMKTQMHPYELCGFMFLLNSCPMLETLTLEIGLRNIFSEYTLPYPINLEKFWEHPRVPSKCLKRTLKVVEVNGFRGSMNEFLACAYFIQAGTVLEKININVLKEEDANSDKKVEMLLGMARFLEKVPKASRNLQISIA
ncbi:putative F-box protein At3g29830 [Gastrolobium bilobum]|uniref:putative F-box protein At3g29830 n=1 Tax=Gastrolobium bilobum TaxID=150636 RepID=UPI002AB24622|nr:putative F-box protein At3g29830 [Gastrolobium bilobum]